MGPPQQIEFDGAVAVLEQVTFHGVDEIRAGHVATLVLQQPVADLGCSDHIDRLLERSHPGILGGGDPLDFPGRLEAAPLLVDVVPRPDVDVTVAQVVGQHGGEVGVDVNCVEAMLAAHRLHERCPTVVLVATLAGRRDVELDNAANRADRRFLARASLFQGACPEDGVRTATVHDHDGIGDEKSGAIQDVGVVIALTKEQYGPVVTHMAERISQVSRCCRGRDAGTQPSRRNRMVRRRICGRRGFPAPRSVDASARSGLKS